MSSFAHKAYTLEISSALPLPELPSGGGGADVRITLSPPAPRAVPGTLCRLEDSNSAYLAWSDVGEFRVRDGCSIEVAPVAGAPDDLVRLFLLGPVFAVLLHQRDHLVLHASAVAIDGRVALFLGGSGWGKSTIAASLHARGGEVITDDVTAIDLSHEIPRTSVGIPWLKLWPDAVGAALGADAGSLPRLRADSEKRAWSSDAPARPSDQFPVHRVYVLEWGDELSIEPLSTQASFIELVRHSYGIDVLHAVSGARLFASRAALANRVGVSRLRRPRDLASLAEVARRVEDDLSHAPALAGAR